jgi:membrane-bound metal-dependent hydrolase YbcI (DUF457 family)
LDTLTHGFVPYAAFTIAKRPRVERIAAAIGGIAPDLDATWAWLSHAHEQAYPLVHRGFSHTIWGAPMLATFLLFFLAHPAIARRLQRFENIWFTKGALLPLLLGAWSHLLLDAITITGIPLFWPAYDGRFTTDWFFFGIPYLLPLSLFGWIMVWRGKATDRVVRRTFVAILVVLLLAGGLRMYTYPRDLEGGEDVTPAPVDWMWYVSKPNETGVLAYATSWGGQRIGEEFLPHHLYDESRDAQRRCEDAVGFVAWKWYLWGDPVIEARRLVHPYDDESRAPGMDSFPLPPGSSIPNGTWDITYQDSAIQYNILHPTFKLWQNPAREEALDDGRAFCQVTPDGDVRFWRERGWIGS